MSNVDRKVRLPIDIELVERAKLAGVDLATAAESVISDAVTMSAARNVERALA